MHVSVDFSEPVNGWWDGGPRRRFEFRIEGLGYGSYTPGDGWVRLGSFSANYWIGFQVKACQDERAVLKSGMSRLRHKLRLPADVTANLSIKED